MNAQRLLTVLFSSILILSGCDCGRRGSVTSTYGEIGIVWTDNGAEQINRDATYDFGTAIMGERVPKQMIIKNLSGGPLTLQTLERTEGSLVTVGEEVVEGSAFDVKFVKETTILAGEELAVDMFFAPPQAKDATIAHEGHMSKLLLSAGGTRADENTAVITLVGNAEAGSCLLPKELDFGAVPTGEKFQLSFDLKNDASVNVAGFVGSPAGADATSFGLAQTSPQGTISIPGKGSTAITFEFAPTENRAYGATVELKAGPQCPAGTVTLKGEGVDEVLSWTPSSLDFGFISPGVLGTRVVKFKNLSKVPITLTNVATNMPSDFAVQADQSNDATKFTIPGGGVETEMTVGCKPTALGLRNANLTFKTGMNKTPGGTVTLKCTGGGPDIKVTPSPTLNFGNISFFPSNLNYSVSRRLTVANVGTIAPGGDPKGNLHMGSIGPNGPGVLPYVAVKLLNGNTQANEIRLGLPSTYDPTKGIEALVGKNSVDLTVTIAPQTAGAKQAELTIFSNDPDEPETKILITADAQQLPPCTYAITPTQLNFGLVTPPGMKDLPFTIRNTATPGGAACELSGIDLSAGSDPAYSIVGGAIASKSLQPGEATQVVVRVHPQAAPANGAMVTLSGYVTFSVNSPTQPTGQVQLTTSVGPSCLTIAPDVLDFGTVKKGCSSATRTFTAYNTCSTDIYIQDITVSVPGGEAAGGPNCPGSTACAEFIVTQKPSIPSGGLRVQPGSTGTSFQAKYAPINYGADQGAVSVVVTQSGQNVTYLVSMSGNGDATGAQTDTYTQDANPKADILLVIDSSCSMEDKQNQLSNNFSAFLQYATAAGVNYNLGVTTTDVEAGGCQTVPGFPPICTNGGPAGKLLGNANNPKVLTPYTPNVAQLYQEKVKVGTSDSGLEKGTHAAMLALTPPLITAENAGFLRPDAKLAVVVVTDAADQSTETIPYYMNRFLNIKGFNKATEFSFNVIGPFLSSAPSGCTYDDVSPDNGRWTSLATQTAGVKSEICNTNWAATLQQLGKTAFGQRTSFFLNAQPDTTGGKTIEVKIDGVVIPQQSGTTTNWTWNSTSNSIDFTAGKAPSSGQSLTVSYFVACL